MSIALKITFLRYTQAIHQSLCSEKFWFNVIFHDKTTSSGESSSTNSLLIPGPQCIELLVWGFVFTFVFIALNILYWIICNTIGNTIGTTVCNTVVHLWSIRIWFYTTFIVLIKSDWSDWLNLCHTSQYNRTPEPFPNAVLHCKSNYHIMKTEEYIQHRESTSTTYCKHTHIHVLHSKTNTFRHTFLSINSKTKIEQKKSGIHCIKMKAKWNSVQLRDRYSFGCNGGVVKRQIITRKAVKKLNPILWRWRWIQLLGTIYLTVSMGMGWEWVLQI